MSSLPIHNLNANNLIKTFKSATVLHGVSLSLSSGEVVGLLGPNGAGKTTSFYIMSGLLEASEGKVFLNEDEITHWSFSKRSREGIRYLPQEASIFKELSVEENLLIAAELAGMDEESARMRIEILLEDYNIEPIRGRLGVSLSGGERRRAEIARALVNKPKFILLDEPFAGVDPLAISDIQHSIQELKKQGIGVLITDHNFRELLAVVDRVYVLKDGCILAHGTAEEIANNAEVKRHYLGEHTKL